MANLTDPSMLRQTNKYIAYVIQGTILAASNFLIFFAIMNNWQLRKAKEYIIISGLAFADALGGLAEAFAGIFRIFLASELGVPTSRLYCMLMPHNLLWAPASPLQNLMLCAVSLDRLYAVARPFKYFGKRAQYAYRLCGVFYGYTAVMTVYGWLDTLLRHDGSDRSVTKECFTSDAFDPSYFQFRLLNGQLGAVISILLYIFILPIYIRNRHISPTATITELRYELQARHQRQLVVTLAYSCLFTLLFTTIGNAGVMFGAWSKSGEMQVSGYILSQCNPLMNLYLYSTRHRDIRMGILKFLGCHSLMAKSARVHHIAQWNNNNSTAVEMRRRPTVPVVSRY